MSDLSDQPSMTHHDHSRAHWLAYYFAWASFGILVIMFCAVKITDLVAF